MDQFHQALAQFEAVVRILAAIEHADQIVADYLDQIAKGYRCIHTHFLSHVDLELEAQNDQTRRTPAKYHALYEPTRAKVREQFSHSRKLWLKATEDTRLGLEVRISQTK